MRNSRRDFLKSSLLTGSALAVPFSIPTLGVAQNDSGRRRMAAIGVGGSHGAWKQGTGDSIWASNYADIVAVCDADALHCDEFNKTYNEHYKNDPKRASETFAKYTDYRKMLEEVKPDVVVIATPDHWHVPISIAAMEAGCDVYCEKPLTLTIAEGQQIRDAVKKYQKVFQVGTQQRSQWGMRFLEAVAMVRDEHLGDVKTVHVAIEGGPGGEAIQSTDEIPESLDWNMWVGPAQQAGYTKHRQKEFRWFYDYSGGKLTDWGAHHIDIAQWALDKQGTGPVKVSGTGRFTDLVPEDFDWNAYLNGEAQLPNGNHTPTEFHLTLTYADGKEIHVHHRYRDDSTRTRMGNGILFEGTDGRMMVNRNRTTGLPYEQLTDADRAKLMETMTALYKGKTPEENHVKNFFDCIEDRSEPVSDVESHVRVMECCHMCNIALMLGRELEWDPENRTFRGDDQAVALMSRPRREGFTWSETT